MRVSEFYHLGRGQGHLSFVDVDLDRDAALFIDPYSLRMLKSEWGAQAVAAIRGFFAAVLESVRADNRLEGTRLLAQLSEPNETRLGVSRDQPRGRAVGRGLATSIWEALAESEAAQTGLLVDLEDTALLVEGISYDIVSDIATNLIRSMLIQYTQDIAAQYDLPTEDVPSGPIWDAPSGQWLPEGFVSLPAPDGVKLLLVPKLIVRKSPAYDVHEYFSNYMLRYLMAYEFSRPTSELVKLLKSGEPRIFKKDLREKYARDGVKRVIAQLSRQHPAALAEYRKDKTEEPLPPASDAELIEVLGGELPDCEPLLDWLCGLEPGRGDAEEFKTAARQLIACLFSPSLAGGREEFQIHEGRKRVDSWFINLADGTTFFGWTRENGIPCANVIVECKNYRDDPANPEFD